MAEDKDKPKETIPRVRKLQEKLKVKREKYKKQLREGKPKKE